MIYIHRVVKNIIAILTGDIISKMLGVATTIFLARYLGPEDYGKYCSVLSYVYVFIVIADFGLNDLIIRDIARNHSLASQYLAASIVIKIGFSFICVIMLMMSVYILGYSHEMIIYMAVLSLTIIFITFCNSLSSICRAFEQMQYSSLLIIINSALFFLFIAGLIYIEGTLLYILFSRVIALCLGSLIGFAIVVKKIARPDFKKIRLFIKKMLKDAFPFLTIGLVNSMYFNLDIIMLSKIKGSVYVGWFTPAANDLFFGINLIVTAIATVAYPIFSRKYADSIDSFRESLNFTLKILIILGVPISFGTFMLAPEIIHTVFGSKYENSIIVLQIISVAISFAFIRDLLGFGWAAAGEVKTLMWLNVLSLGMNAVLNLIFIPLYAHIGASMASVFCIFSSFVIGYRLLNNKVKQLIILKSFIKPLIASLIMCAAIFIFNTLHVVILISFGAAVYFCALFLLRTFNAYEVLLLKESFKAR
jgi:O-antigen/teichoic acid export membrane protein